MKCIAILPPFVERGTRAADERQGVVSDLAGWQTVECLVNVGWDGGQFLVAE